MDSIYVTLIISLLLVVPIVLLKCFSTTSGRKLPPGPFGLPLIGHLHLLGVHPHESLAQLAQKYGDLMYIKFGHKGSIVVSSPEMAQELLKTHDATFSHRPRLTMAQHVFYKQEDLIWQSNTPEWRNLRKIFMMEIMRPDQLEASGRARADEVANMLQFINKAFNSRPNSSIQINKILWLSMSNMISRIALGEQYFPLDPSDENVEANEFKSMIRDLVTLMGAIVPGDSFPFLARFDIGSYVQRAKDLNKRLDKFLSTLLNKRRARRKQRVANQEMDTDVLDVLLTQFEKEGDELHSENQLKGMLLDIFAGGTDTQIITSEWAMAHVLTDPELMQQMQLELDTVVGQTRTVQESDIPKLKLLQAVVKETFRFHPPVPLLAPHESHEACQIAGYYVPAHTSLYINVWAMGRDSRLWDAPLTFNPHRFMEGPLQEVDVKGQNYQLIPFGSGRRMCPAVQMGMLTVQMAVASLLHAFDWSLPDGLKPQDLDMAEGHGLTAPMLTPLCAIPKPRLPDHEFV